jgi:4-hydroxy-tetrahydrodipicolinate synthase
MSLPKLPRGVITATVTPMNSDLSPDHGLLREHCRYILDKGGNGILLLGTTGEANSFSVKERKSILERLIVNGIDPASLLVGTGTCALTETVELTDHATAQGVGGVLVMPPYYYRKVTDDGLFGYFSQLFDRVNDDVRLYLYHFPAMSGIDMSMDLLGKLINAFPERFTGIKDSSGDLGHMLEILRRFPQFRVYSGTERLLIETLEQGSEGCISATTNYSIEDVAEVYYSYLQKTEMAIARANMLGARKAFEGNVLACAVKAMLAVRSGIQSWKNVRPPLSLPPSDVVSQIKNDLDALH